MKTFDRYVVRSFLISAVLCFLVLIAIRILGDLSANMDEFAEQTAGDEAKSAGTVLRHIGAYYACQSLVYWRELSGVIIVTAACFTLAWMNHTNELTAVLASGVSLRRVLLPVVLVAIGLNLLVIVDTEWLIPPVKHRLVRSPDDVTGSQEFQVRLIADRSDSVWYSRRFLPAEDVLERPLIVLRDEELALAGHVTGSSARYDNRYKGWWILSDPEAPGRRDARMHLVGAPAAYTTTFLPSRFVPRHGQPVRNVVAPCPQEHLVIRARLSEPAPPGHPNRAVLHHARFNFLRRHDRPTVSIFADRATYSGRSFGWTLEGGRMMCLTDLDPNAMSLRRSSDAARYMSTAELNGLLKLPRIPDPAGVRLTRHARFADFFNNIIMLLVAVPFILSRERNIKASALMALVSVAVVYVCIYVFRHLQIPPILAAWAPILIFGPVSAVTVDAVKT